MSDEKREMTLDEWCAKLHESHLVNRELTQLRAEVERLSDELNAEKFRTCERCIEKTATICIELMDQSETFEEGCEAIRKEFNP